MQSVSANFIRAVRSGGQIACRIDAVSAGMTLATDLALSAGSVSVDATSATRAQFSGTFADKRLAPVLAQPGVELVVKAGVRFFGTTELVPVGVFPVGSVELAYGPVPGVKVSAPDRWAVVQRSRFEFPRAWDGAWSSASDAIVALMTGPWQDRLVANPGLPVPGVTNLLPSAGARQPQLVWARDRDKAITDMVTSVGAEGFFDENGDVVLRAIPALAGSGVWDADAGASGVLVSASRKFDYEQVYNAVVVHGVSADTTSTITATGVAQINDASQPLWVGGAFGLVPYFYSSPMIATDAQAAATASSLLNGAASFNAQLTATCVPNPALQAGDTVNVRFPDGSTERHVVQGLSIPLTLSDWASGQTLTLRSSKTALPAETSA